MNDATIHLWMSKGVFRPFRYEPPPTGPGRGCLLDLADLITIGVIHSLLRFGVRFEGLKVSSADSRTKLFFLPDDDARRDPSYRAYESVAETNSSTRRIQEYLEYHNFKVIAAWAPYYEPIINSDVIFYPSTGPASEDSFMFRVRDPKPHLLGHCFINCQTWYWYVYEQLRGASMW